MQNCQQQKLKCSHIVFHDVDMIPVDVDYSVSEVPLHLATNFVVDEGEKDRENFDEYFGGVTMFPIKIFESINGYSNKYWGWGFEDDDLLLRCKHHSIELNKIQIKNIGNHKNVLKFNGVDAYVKSNNIIDLTNDFTITICFYPDELVLEHTKQSDEFTIFSIPGYDFAISYTSFGRYNFCTFDNKLKAHYLNSNIKPVYKTNISLVYDSVTTIITMYQDGEIIGQTNPINRFNTMYRREPNFYLGVGNPNRSIIPNWFKGLFEYFGVYNKKLSQNEIKEICKNGIKSDEALKTHYNSNYIFNYKLVDLSENNNVGIIHKCEIIKDDTPEYKTFFIPHRKKSLFKSLKHEENGFNGNRWKDDNTRWNQLRFINEVSKNYELLEKDGLSDLKFTEHGVNVLEKNVKLINVGI